MSSSSSNLLALISFSVLVLSVQLPELFGTPFLTQSVHPIHLTLLGGILKHTFSEQLLIPLAANPSAFDSLM